MSSAHPSSENISPVSPCPLPLPGLPASRSPPTTFPYSSSCNAPETKVDYTQTRSWRPISLLSCLGKGLERLVARRIAHTALTQRVLSPQQIGALPKWSTVEGCHVTLLAFPHSSIFLDVDHLKWEVCLCRSHVQHTHHNGHAIAPFLPLSLPPLARIIPEHFIQAALPSREDDRRSWCSLVAAGLTGRNHWLWMRRDATWLAVLAWSNFTESSPRGM